MNLEAGHYENSGAQARLKNSGADVRGDDWHRGTRVRTEDAGRGRARWARTRWPGTKCCGAVRSMRRAAKAFEEND